MSQSDTPILGFLWPDRCDQERHWLFRKSEVFRYAMKGTTADNRNGDYAFNKTLSDYVSEQCVAAGRLMQVAVSQYESIAYGMHSSHLDSRTLPAWMLISSSFSAVDAMVAAIASIICGYVPKTERKIPGMNSFKEFLTNNGQGRHEILKCVEALGRSEWYKALDEARHRILHRGFWPMSSSLMFGDSRWHLVHSPYFMDLDRDGNGEGRLPALSQCDVLDLLKIVSGLLWDLEEWESSIADILVESPFFESTWTGPVEQIIRLKAFDHLLPEACHLNV